MRVRFKSLFVLALVAGATTFSPQEVQAGPCYDYFDMCERAYTVCLTDCPHEFTMAPYYMNCLDYCGMYIEQCYSVANQVCAQYPE